MNWIFFGLVAISVLTGAFTGTMKPVMDASLASAEKAIGLAIGLIGQMTLWLGLVGVLRESGLLRSLGRGLRPLMSRLFPEVPADHPAMSAMIMNMSANLLGLGNAATPFGLKAMQELDKLNPRKGVATNSMALFLSINTAGVALLPLQAIALRKAAGSQDPAGIIVPTLIASLAATLCAVTAAKLLERRASFAPERYGPVDVDPALLKAPDASALERAEALAAKTVDAPRWRQLVAAAIGVAMAVALALHLRAAPPGVGGFDLLRGVLSEWLLPVLILAIVTLGFGRQVKVYEVFVTAAKDGFQTVVGIIPYLVGMLVVIGMFQASGAMAVMVKLIAPVVAPFGFPPEALPMALLRPFSGSGAQGVMTHALGAYGADSFVGYLISVLNGSTETTFYVLAVYYGSVQVKVLRHSLAACVVSDFAGPIAALLVCKAFFAGAPYVLAR